MPKKSEIEELMRQMLNLAHNDSNILGLFVGGSRGKGLITQYSDYDIGLVVKDEAKQEYKEKYGRFGRPKIEVSVITLNELKQDGAWGSNTFWNRYNYIRLKAQVDKTGKIQKIINKKGKVPKDKQQDFINSSLDHYVNQVFRSVKCYRDGNLKAAQFEAAESISPLLDAVFGLEGRIKPYYKYLEWELTNYPLKKLAWSEEVFTDVLLKIIQTTDPKAQQQVLKLVEKTFKKEGFNKVFKAWGDKLTWMKEFEVK